MRLPFQAWAPVALVVELGEAARLPEPATHLGFRCVRIDPGLASAPARVAAALGCATGQLELLAGALA